MSSTSFKRMGMISGVRRSAKQTVEDFANELIKDFDIDKSETARDWSRTQIFALERLAIRMNWKTLETKLKKWRSDSLRSEVFPAASTQTKGK
jgi:hypothetical protein